MRMEKSKEWAGIKVKKNGGEVFFLELILRKRFFFEVISKWGRLIYDLSDKSEQFSLLFVLTSRANKDKIKETKTVKEGDHWNNY